MLLEELIHSWEAEDEERRALKIAAQHTWVVGTKELRYSAKFLLLTSTLQLVPKMRTVLQGLLSPCPELCKQGTPLSCDVHIIITARQECLT